MISALTNNKMYSSFISICSLRLCISTLATLKLQ